MSIQFSKQNYCDFLEDQSTPCMFPIYQHYQLQVRFLRTKMMWNIAKTFCCNFTRCQSSFTAGDSTSLPKTAQRRLYTWLFPNSNMFYKKCSNMHIIAHNRLNYVELACHKALMNNRTSFWAIHPIGPIAEEQRYSNHRCCGGVTTRSWGLQRACTA